VFFSWFQSVAVGVLVELGHIEGIEDAEAEDGDAHSPQEVAQGIQSLLITMEMLLAALAFYTSFSASEFLLDSLPAHFQPQYSPLPTSPPPKIAARDSDTVAFDDHDSDITPTASPYETDIESDLNILNETAEARMSQSDRDSSDSILLKRPTGNYSHISILHFLPITNLLYYCGPVHAIHSTRSSFWGDILRLLGGGVDSAKEKIDRNISTSSDQHSASDLSDDSSHGAGESRNQNNPRHDNVLYRLKNKVPTSPAEKLSPVRIPSFERKGHSNSSDNTPMHILRYPFQIAPIVDGRKLFEGDKLS
jgi:hypothetical protein